MKYFHSCEESLGEAKCKNYPRKFASSVDIVDHCTPKDIHKQIREVARHDKYLKQKCVP